MSLTVVGSVALDTIGTPSGKVEKVEGGSATYASLAASYFTKPCLVGVVGTDTYDRFRKIFQKREIVIDALIKKEGLTFHWEGEYQDDLNDAITHSTCLNVFADFDPKLPENYLKNPGVFLGNISPKLQLSVLKQCRKSMLKAADTMNYWISTVIDQVWEVVPEVDIMFINNKEALTLTGEKNLHRAAERIMERGLRYLVIKKGEFGVNLYGEGKLFCAPAYPLTDVKDPTGAGDCFAGGFLGYLCENLPITFPKLKKACLYGTVMSSLNIEGFSIEKLLDIKRETIEERYRKLLEICDTGDIQ
ncbi:MAG: PfkB family carbohydrate kinase [Candidatus Wallbacteria bacterium]|nr:PfkB family carbohydrate kinase [Candidatus Wallbacteria bacterium]